MSDRTPAPTVSPGSPLDCTDNARAYRTRSGLKVVVHEVVWLNSLGENVTFPVKGSVSDPSRPRRRRRYQIFTPDGRASVFGPHPDDIVALWDDPAAG